MDIRAKTSFAGRNYNAVEGQVLNLPDSIAQDLIRAGYAEAVENEDKRNNDGDDIVPAKRKRSSAKR